MKAPDKIYAEVNDNGFVCGYAEPIKKDDIEYIHKDALLEWLEEKKERLEIFSDNDAARWGQRNAFQQVIDKINSL